LSYTRNTTPMIATGPIVAARDILLKRDYTVKVKHIICTGR